MKRLIALLFAALLLLPAFAALAQPRYPGSQGPVTDAAAVLSSGTARDLRTLAERFMDADTLKLRVATVDFLDGASLSAYGEGLREQWGLDEDELLLLMAVGEDKFGFFGGAYVNDHLSAATLQKLLSTRFEALFLQQDYDGAIAALMPALATEVGKAWRADVSVRGLFGQSDQAERLDWLDRAVEQPERRAGRDSRDAIEDGLSLGKVVLTVLLLLVIFGNRGRKNREGCGCGCMPFSSLLAGWGLWRLWKK